MTCHDCLTQLITRQQAVETAMQTGNYARMKDAVRGMRRELDRCIVRTIQRGDRPHDRTSN
jgi:hypothetical protein